jgi:hypothetical protein
MNVKLVESLAQIIDSLTPEEKAFLEKKIVTKSTDIGLTKTLDSFSHLGTSPQQRAKAFSEWAESHPRNTPILSDEAISRESIYGERG